MESQSSTTAITKDTPSPRAEKPPRNRLTREGTRFLEDYWNLHPGRIPLPSVLISLTAQIQNIPQNAFYKTANTREWFRRRAQRASMLPLNSTTPTVDPRFPSLTPAALEHLKVLFSGQPDPSTEVINTWAALLSVTGATYQDVISWVNSGVHSMYLPTPADTMTPESSLSPISPTHHYTFMKTEPTLSPVIPPAGLDIPPSHQHIHMSVPLPTSPLSSPPPRLNTCPTFQAIIQGMTDSVSNPSPPSDVRPSTAVEFNALFAPYEKQLSQLIQALESSS